MKNNLLNLIIILICIFFVTGCSFSLKKKIIPPEKPSYKSSETKKKGTQKPYKIKGVKYKPLASATGFEEIGIASWYGKKFHGKKTANGETYNMYAMTAAHKTLPIGTWVKVHNLDNKKKIVVRLNDRGPFIRGRIIDLSYAGAKRIGIVESGTARVRITSLGQATSYSKTTNKPISFKPINYLKGNFSVQVASFKNKSNALKYKNKLSKRFNNAHIKAINSSKGKLYRVRIGKFSNLKTAEAFNKKLRKKGFKKSLLIAE